MGYERYYECKCDCGETTTVTLNYLKRKKNSIKSCGCLQRESVTTPLKNGDRFGQLVLIERIGTASYGDPIWKCQCDCGNTKNIATRSLVSGLTKSCGCYRNKRVYETISTDLTNQKFGKLTALYPIIGNNKSGGVTWHCKCDCGNEKDIVLSNLISGNTTSCGCLKISKGEYAISKILQEHNIDFIQEYTPKNLPFKGRFDFYIPTEKYFIEFDGQQHFENIKFFGGEKDFNKRIERDKIKNQWCKDNNIPLIRIPYTHYNNLCLEDLLLETSQFIV